MKKEVVILGGGESGVGAAILAKKKGYPVVLMDEGSLKEGYRNELQHAGIEWQEGSVDEQRLLNADEVVKSPGIPEKNRLVKMLRQKEVPIIGEIELAYRHKGDSKIIAIRQQWQKHHHGTCLSHLQNSGAGLCVSG
jgi:UDP-N-acetylmuramoylalanine--D-glutamate ligase